MGSVIKGHGYRLIDNRSFEMPLPVRYELLKGDDPIALYEISEDERVSFDILTKYKENMLTPINRGLDISDMYFFFSSRVFQNGTPYTAYELQLLGLERYNVFDIIRKTRGITPYDTYWLRFDGDKCDYETARTAWNEVMSRVAAPAAPASAAASTAYDVDSDPLMPDDPLRFVATSTRTLDSEEISHVDDILNQHTVNVGEVLPAENKEEEKHAVTNNTMSADEIEALLAQAGLGDLGASPAPDPKPAPEPESASSGGKMSQEDIEKMLAAASAPEPEVTPEPTPEPASSGGKMSQEDIEKMLAAASAPEPEPAPAEEPKSSGGKMSQEDIEKMLAAASAPEPEPAPEPASSGGKMSQEDIEKMLAAASAPEPEVTPEPTPEPASSGGKMSQEDIEKMLANAAQAEVPSIDQPEADEPDTPEPEAAPTPSGGKMSQDDIEALLNGMKEDAGQ